MNGQTAIAKCFRIVLTKEWYMQATLARYGIWLGRVTYSVLLVTSVLLSAGCSRSVPQSTTPPARANIASEYPPLGEGKLIEPGIKFYETMAHSSVGQRKLWLYLPDPLPAGSLPCVLIGPAGSRLFHGMALGDGDRDEHLPYVKAGFAVVAFEIYSPLNESPTDEEVKQAARQFLSGDGGLFDVRIAFDYAKKRVPGVNPDKIFIAGHSSAATLALQAIATEKDLAGCIAYAPCTDLEKYFNDGLPELEQVAPGFAAFAKRSSPINFAANIRKPLFLFHAEDDTTIDRAQIDKFLANSPNGKGTLQFVSVKSGGHYDSMIHEGIPAGIKWLKQRVNE